VAAPLQLTTAPQLLGALPRLPATLASGGTTSHSSSCLCPWISSIACGKHREHVLRWHERHRALPSHAVKRPTASQGGCPSPGTSTTSPPEAGLGGGSDSPQGRGEAAAPKGRGAASAPPVLTSSCRRRKWGPPPPSPPNPSGISEMRGQERKVGLGRVWSGCGEAEHPRCWCGRERGREGGFSEAEQGGRRRERSE